MMLASATKTQRYLIFAGLALLLVGVILSIAIVRPPRDTASGSAGTGPDMRSRAAIRESGFDFLDHELRYAGGYGLEPAPVVERGASFDFVDHELRYAGGYGLAPATDGVK